jgi:hypothetical protein
MIARWTKRTAAAVAMVACVSSAALSEGVVQVAAGPTCPSDQVIQAMQVRLLQTELMVAALQCRAVPNLDFTGKYNAFVTQFGGPLTQNANVLKEHFRKTFGNGSMTQLDRYMTRIANDAGQRGMTPGFCQNMQPLFDKVLNIKSTELTTFSKQNLAIPATRDGC